MSNTINNNIQNTLQNTLQNTQQNQELAKYYQKIRLNNNLVPLFLGKGKQRLIQLCELSDEVNIKFVSLKDKHFSLVIIKSDNESEFNRVLDAINNNIKVSSERLGSISEQKKNNKMLKRKLRENKIKNELKEKIQNELKEKELEKLKLEAKQDNENESSDEEPDEARLATNPFHLLEIYD